MIESKRSEKGRVKGKGGGEGEGRKTEMMKKGRGKWGERGKWWRGEKRMGERIGRRWDEGRKWEE